MRVYVRQRFKEAMPFMRDAPRYAMRDDARI